MRFFDVHEKISGVTQEQLKRLAGGSAGVTCTIYYSPAGRVFCLCDAPSREAILEEHRQLGIPCDACWEVESLS